MMDTLLLLCTAVVTSLDHWLGLESDPWRSPASARWTVLSQVSAHLCQHSVPSVYLITLHSIKLNHTGWKTLRIH